MSKVIRRVKGNDGNPVGTWHINHMLDTSEYTIKIYYCSSQEITANIIAASMFAQIYPKGHHCQLLKEMPNHSKYRSSIPISYHMIRLQNGNMVPNKTTQGWELLVEWKDVSSTWIPLKYLKAFNTVKLAEYEAGNRLYVEPSFKWWVRDVLRHCNIIIAKVKAKH